jgi:hypothetical protein
MALSRHGGISHMSVRCCERVIAQIVQRARRHDRAREERKTIGALFIDIFEARPRRSAARSSWRMARSIPT